MYNSEAPVPENKIFEMDLPLLGICYGHQLIVNKFGGKVKRANKEYGSSLLSMDKNSGLLDGIGESIRAWMSHGDEAEEIPGRLTSTFSKLAKKYNLWLIPGSIYESEKKDVYNTAPVFSSNGDLVGKYRKRYPWCPYEKTTPGEEPFVFDIKGKASSL